MSSRNHGGAVLPLNYWRRRIFANRERMAGINTRRCRIPSAASRRESPSAARTPRREVPRGQQAFLDTKNRSYKFIGAFHGLNSLFTGLLYTIVVVEAAAAPWPQGRSPY